MQNSDVPRQIVCPDCGGHAHLISHLPDPGEPLDDGEMILAYRCEDCLDRWDVVWEDTGDSGAPDDDF